MIILEVLAVIAVIVIGGTLIGIAAAVLADWASGL